MDYYCLGSAADLEGAQEALSEEEYTTLALFTTELSRIILDVLTSMEKGPLPRSCSFYDFSGASMVTIVNAMQCGLGGGMRWGGGQWGAVRWNWVQWDGARSQIRSSVKSTRNGGKTNLYRLSLTLTRLLCPAQRQTRMRQGKHRVASPRQSQRVSPSWSTFRSCGSCV